MKGRRLSLYALLFAVLAPWPANAHTGLGAEHFISFEDWMVWPLALGMIWYVAGCLRIKRGADRAPRARAGWFVAAWLVLAATIATPLHEAGERSFAAH